MTEAERLASPAADALAAQVVQAANASDALARQALAHPLPGPLSDAFAPQADTKIKVGPYTVRRLTDGDLETLWQLGNELAKEIVGSVKGEKVDLNHPRGPSLWQIIWVLTRESRQVREMKRKEGIKAIEIAAEDQFGELNLEQLMALYTAVCEQIPFYFSSIIGYGSKQEGEAVSRAPFSSDQTLTG